MPPGENPCHKWIAAQRNKCSDITVKFLLAKGTEHFLAKGAGLFEDHNRGVNGIPSSMAQKAQKRAQ